MTDQIQTSLHGSRIGINASNQLVAQGTDGKEYAVTNVPGPTTEINAAGVAAQIGAPAGSGVACAITRLGSGLARLDFTFTNVAVTHTDAAGSGSSGSLKIFDFIEGAWQVIASRSDLSFLGDALIDSNAGNMAFVYGFGSVAANAGDGALTGTEVDAAAVSGTITLAAKVATSASLLKGAGTPMDGTATATDLYFNESGTAATSTANGVLTFSGTATFIVVRIGDD